MVTIPGTAATTVPVPRGDLGGGGWPGQLVAFPRFPFLFAECQAVPGQACSPPLGLEHL